MPDPANDPSGILNHVLERFQSLDVTGEIMIQDAHYKGTPNSDIHRGRWRRRDDKLVAVRQLRSYGFSDLTELHKSIALELRLWARLSHPNVLPLLGYCLNFGPYPALISEWMENGTVLEYLEKNKLADRFQMIQGVASGLHYLHEHDVVHSDLKCANVVVSPQGVPLLMDFGLSRLLVISSVIKTTKEMGGTLRWMARECFTGSDDDTLEERPTIATKETDIWALGVTAMEIITGELPYASAKSSGQIVADVISGKLPYKRAQGMDERLWRICAQCWSPIPSARPSMFEVVRALQGMQKTEEKCSQLIRGGMKSSIENVIQKFSTLQVLVVGKSTAGVPSVVSEIGKVDTVKTTSSLKSIKGAIKRSLSSESGDSEIISPTYGLVIHKFPGFEKESDKHFKAAKEFIESRRCKDNFDDMLHAIWLCIEMHPEGRKQLDPVTEAFLKLDFGKIPVIAVFTKFESIVNKMKADYVMDPRYSFYNSMKEENQTKLQSLAESKANKHFRHACIPALVKAYNGRDLPVVRLNTGPNHLDVPNLVGITKAQILHVVQKAISDDRATMITNSSSKIAASVNAGAKSEYFLLSGDTREENLNAIHADILTKWGVQDPDSLLSSAKFKSQILRISDVSAFDSLSSRDKLMLNLMAYIIDLTLIMDNLFWLLPSNVKGIRFRTPVTSDSVEMAVTAFVDGPAKNDIHDKVLSYVKETRDKYYPTEHVKNAITGLIRTHRFQLHDD